MYIDVVERPISFYPSMVMAILERRKRNTRRIVNRLRGFGKITEFGPSTTPGYDWEFRDRRGCRNSIDNRSLVEKYCPYGKVGDLLWVRECHVETSIPGDCVYYAGFTDRRGDFWASISRDPRGVRWRPSIHMPRRYARILLRIAQIRAERLQDITEEDAFAEGIDTEGDAYVRAEHARLGGIAVVPAIAAFADLWDRINADRGYPWERNDLIWVITFEIASYSEGVK